MRKSIIILSVLLLASSAMASGFSACEWKKNKYVCKKIGCIDAEEWIEIQQKVASFQKAEKPEYMDSEKALAYAIALQKQEEFAAEVDNFLDRLANDGLCLKRRKGGVTALAFSDYSARIPSYFYGR